MQSPVSNRFRRSHWKRTELAIQYSTEIESQQSARLTALSRRFLSRRPLIPAMTKLSEITVSGEYTIHLIEDSGEESIRLKRRGICQGRVLNVLHTGDPMIVRVVGSRVGVSRKLAERVIVDQRVEVASASDEPVASGMA